MTVSDSVSMSFCGVLKGHSDWVTSIACPSTPDSDVVVSASRDKSIMIWQLTRTTDNYAIPKKSLHGHNHFIQDLTLSRDGQYALTASWDSTLRLWDLNECKTAARFVGHAGDVLSVSLSPDNRQIVSGSRDKTIKVWNIKGECKYTMSEGGHTEWVSCTRFSPDHEQNQMVSCGWDKVVKVWDMSKLKCSVSHMGHGGYVNVVMVSPDGSLCASGGKDGKIMLWDLKEKQFLYHLDAEDEIHALAFSPTQYWLTAATDSGIKIFDLESKSTVQELRPEFDQRTGSLRSGCTSLAWSADGSVLFSGYKDNAIRVWQVNA